MKKENSLYKHSNLPLYSKYQQISSQSCNKHPFAFEFCGKIGDEGANAIAFYGDRAYLGSGGAVIKNARTWETLATRAVYTWDKGTILQFAFYNDIAYIILGYSIDGGPYICKNATHLEDCHLAQIPGNPPSMYVSGISFWNNHAYLVYEEFWRVSRCNLELTTCTEDYFGDGTFRRPISITIIPAIAS